MQTAWPDGSASSELPALHDECRGAAPVERPRSTTHDLTPSRSRRTARSQQPGRRGRSCAPNHRSTSSNAAAGVDSFSIRAHRTVGGLLSARRSSPFRRSSRARSPRATPSVSWVASEVTTAFRPAFVRAATGDDDGRVFMGILPPATLGFPHHAQVGPSVDGLPPRSTRRRPAGRHDSQRRSR